jgi:tetratricopeptide (TPR) repeat protein
MPRPLSTAEAARIVGLTESQVRALLRAALGRPRTRGRRYAVTFQDLVTLKAARTLLDARVPSARVRRALTTLAERGARPLSEVRLLPLGRRIAADDGAGSWEPETGQALLDLRIGGRRSGAPSAGQTAAAAAPRPLAHGRARAEFERGLALEDADPGAARGAYQRALTINPELVDAYINLGRLWHEGGDAPRALALYREALSRAPEDPVVHFNLALALEDTREAAAALDHYRYALTLDPDFSDAHYNLARICEVLGRAEEALQHYRAYRKLTDG